MANSHMNKGYEMHPPPQQMIDRHEQSHPQHMTGEHGHSHPQHMMGGHGQFHPPQQQQQQQQTTVIIQQPTVQTNPLLIGTIHGTREWSTGLFECCTDVGNCMFVYFCYCCAMSTIVTRLGESCCTSCCVPCAEIGIRTRVRTLGGIRGSMCGDCMTIAFCTLCATCQEHRELNAMGL
ncbi:placenta-specific gene 8 protein-like [Mytilus trossulus]|uniref:placenta-specific gene 8 protein-like n=1 Tax=Mytilus trossulus TaxID=6551 RepID=UPI003006EC67